MLFFGTHILCHHLHTNSTRITRAFWIKKKSLYFFFFLKYSICIWVNEKKSTISDLVLSNLSIQIIIRLSFIRKILKLKYLYCNYKNCNTFNILEKMSKYFLICYATQNLRGFNSNSLYELKINIDKLLLHFIRKWKMQYWNYPLNFYLLWWYSSHLGILLMYVHVFSYYWNVCKWILFHYSYQYYRLNADLRA